MLHIRLLLLSLDNHRHVTINTGGSVGAPLIQVNTLVEIAGRVECGCGVNYLDRRTI